MLRRRQVSELGFGLADLLSPLPKVFELQEKRRGFDAIHALKLYFLNLWGCLVWESRSWLGRMQLPNLTTLIPTSRHSSANFRDHFVHHWNHWRSVQKWADTRNILRHYQRTPLYQTSTFSPLYETFTFSVSLSDPCKLSTQLITHLFSVKECGRYSFWV